MEAGMDAYVAKPVRTHELLEAMGTVLARTERQDGPLRGDAAHTETQGQPISGSMEIKAAAVNRASLLDRVGGDVGLLREIVGMFREECPEHLSRIQGAVAGSDCDCLQRTAHAFKGLLANLGAEEAARIALRLETMGRNGKLEGAGDAFASLRAETERLLPTLGDLVNGGGGP
jgi:HPt (histidine-containing phosphotransfer) domain-containing protein